METVVDYDLNKETKNSFIESSSEGNKNERNREILLAYTHIRLV